MVEIKIMNDYTLCEYSLYRLTDIMNIIYKNGKHSMIKYNY